MQEGTLRLVPLYLPEDVEVTAITTHTFTPNNFDYHGLVGRTTSGEDVQVVSLDLPSFWPGARDQRETELRHGRRLLVDLRARGHDHSLTDVRAGPDPNEPPDLIIRHSSGREIRVEHTSLSLPQRREAWQGLRALRSKLRLEGPRRFRALRGHLVYLWFSADTSLGLDRPPSARGTSTLDTLVEVLASHRPDPRKMTFSDLPQSLSGHDLGWADTAAARFYALPSDLPPSPFALLMGFEFGLAFTTLHTRTQIRTAIAEAVKRKDRPENDWLLVTAGGPGKTGEAFYSEEVVAEFLTDTALQVDPDHLQRVLLHRWMTGDVWEIHPDHRRLAEAAVPPG